MTRKPALFAELTIRVYYDLNGTDPKELLYRIERLPGFAAGEGMFTGASEAEVTDWDYVLHHEIIEQ